jgi:hypothetical protein
MDLESQSDSMRACPEARLMLTKPIGERLCKMRPVILSESIIRDKFIWSPGPLLVFRLCSTYWTDGRSDSNLRNVCFYEFAELSDIEFLKPALKKRQLTCS